MFAEFLELYDKSPSESEPITYSMLTTGIPPLTPLLVHAGKALCIDSAHVKKKLAYYFSVSTS